jgi:threonine/homoserine/homoserine lactone efflux protein
MNTTLYALAITAITISFFHTASGPDHYLPFIVLSKSKKWSLGKTILWTIICGLGHVFSSVILGIIGVYLGWQLNKISWLQDVRGNVSSWALFIFGLGYLIYGIWKMSKKHSHKHFDVMGDEVYVHEHTHGKSASGHHHHHQKTKVTPLVLFAIFVMGPSEPLIPLLFFSGAHRSMTEVITLISTFTITTVVTMVGMVLLGIYGYNLLNTEKLDRYVHAISGAVLSICGAGMLFLGW